MMKIYITQLVGVINTYTHRYIKHIRTHARANTHTRGSKYKTRVLMVSLTTAPAVQNDVLKMTFWRIPREPRSQYCKKGHQCYRLFKLKSLIYNTTILQKL